MIPGLLTFLLTSFINGYDCDELRVHIFCQNLARFWVFPALFRILWDLKDCTTQFENALLFVCFLDVLKSRDFMVTHSPTPEYILPLAI